ncbi:MAG: hypothetical protein ACKOXK_01920 [Chakrabartia sp.]
MTGDSKIVGIRPQHNVAGSGKGRGKPRAADIAAEALPEPDDSPKARWGMRLGAAFGVIVALAWTALATLSFLETIGFQAVTISQITQFLAGLSAPLALIALVWAIVQRTSMGATRRFATTVRALRQEEARLAETLGDMAQRIDANRDALAAQAELMATLGEETTDRLAEATRSMQGQVDAINRHAATLESRTSGARSDMNSLLTDMPRAHAEVHRFAELLDTTGQSALASANELAAQLALLAERGRNADDIASRAAQRLAERVAGLDDMARIAVARIEEAAEATTLSVRTALENAQEGLSIARETLDSQAADIARLMDESHARIAAAGVQATQNVADRVSDIAKRLTEVGQIFAAQDAQSRALLQAIAAEISQLDARLGDLGNQSDASAAQAIQALQQVREQSDLLNTALDNGSRATQSLTDLSGTLLSTLQAAIQEINEALPRAHQQLEDTAAASRKAAREAMPDIAALEASASTALERLRDAEGLLAEQRALIDTLIQAADAALAESRSTAQALTKDLEAAEEQTRSLTGSAAPLLIEALLRIKDTANQAAEHARTALDSIVPDAAGKLGDEARTALEAALAGPVEAQMAHIAARAEQAIAAARQAATQLTADVAAIDAAALGLEDRIDTAKDAAVRGDNAQFARRMARIIEDLQSSAINVSKILDADVTDTAWGAYLRGERGIFTRQAVRLVSGGEAREIRRLYRDDDDLREQINLYVHDFEVMLRNVMATRDGEAFSVALVSSDAGKLYVALAQAIERLR